MQKYGGNCRKKQAGEALLSNRRHFGEKNTAAVTKRLASQNKKAIFAAVKNPPLDFKVSGYGLIYIILTWQ